MPLTPVSPPPPAQRETSPRGPGDGDGPQATRGWTTLGGDRATVEVSGASEANYRGHASARQDQVRVGRGRGFDRHRTRLLERRWRKRELHREGPLPERHATDAE